MKRILTTLLAVLMTLSIIYIAPVYGSEPECDLFLQNLDRETKQAAAYLIQKDPATYESFGAKESMIYLNMLRAGRDMSGYQGAFLKSVQESLEKQDGKIIYEDKHGAKLNQVEDDAIYASLILILQACGMNPADFHGYNLVERFENYEPDATMKKDYYGYTVNPYYYCFLTEAAQAIGNSALAEKIFAYETDELYTDGKGMNYYGYSCDNTSMYVLSIPDSKLTGAKARDAKKLVKSYISEAGANYNDTYTNKNGDSTALAMAALSKLGDVEEAINLYGVLYRSFRHASGVYYYDPSGSGNTILSTKDAMTGIYYLKQAVKGKSLTHHYDVTFDWNADHSAADATLFCYLCEKSDQKVKADIKVSDQKADLSHTGQKMITASITKDGVTYSEDYVKQIYHYPKSIKLSCTSTVYTGKALKPTVTVKDETGQKIDPSAYTVTYQNNTNVGTANVTVTFKAAANIKGTVTKTFDIVPKATKISKIAAAKKGFKVTWKKQATQTSGYEVAYDTSSSMKNQKIKKISSNKTTSLKVTKLSAQKKYYVRVRTCKKAGGKTYYSAWSSIKTVTTK